MNGPRELFTALLRLATALTATILAVTAWIHWHIAYPVTRAVESWIYQFDSVMQQGTLQTEQFAMIYVQEMGQFGLLMAHHMQYPFHPFLLYSTT